MVAPRSTIGILMNEHQLILRMIAQLRAHAEQTIAGVPLDPMFIAVAVDFVRSYADRCHHGKEEEILFRLLAEKPLSEQDAEDMRQLIADHAWARGKVRELVDASERYFAGQEDEGLMAARAMLELADFYPGHIAREDTGFFRSAIGYFSAEERAAMDAESREFDRLLIHERYRSVVEGIEAGFQS